MNAPQYDPWALAREHPAIKPQGKPKRTGCCLAPFLAVLILLLPVLIYFLAPLHTNILVMGIDARPTEGNYGRTDTMILATVNPLKPHVAALSIPRDLWVAIPGYGENRINTAHFFAEADKPGSGPAAAIQTVKDNFGVQADYYIRIRFDGFKDVVDALDGVDVVLPEDMSGYTAGKHHLDGAEALALVRDREGSDDFYRMQRAQIFLKSVWKQAIQPGSWSRLPAVWQALGQTVDTNLPAWQWPRLALALLRAGPDGIDTRTINREMVKPFITDAGADVLAPNWEVIRPMVDEMFK